MSFLRKVLVIDSHTGGEPTRIVVTGGPELGGGSVAERSLRFRDHHDGFRSFVADEPRGSDILVGGLLVPSEDHANACGIIFFNNISTLGMCGHGTIGLMATLAHLGRNGIGAHRIETTVGVVTATWEGNGRSAVRNVHSYRHAENVSVNVEGYGWVTGDVAWGGNWFFLVGEHRETLEVRNSKRLIDVCTRIRDALVASGTTGANGAEIDHIELFSAPADPQNHSRNFVFCPGSAYDRSPCGTGTSAKLACLAASEKWPPGEIWRQESIIGSVFEAHYERDGNGIIPTICGSAYITAETTLLLEDGDPFPAGVPTK